MLKKYKLLKIKIIKYKFCLYFERKELNKILLQRGILLWKY